MKKKTNKMKLSDKQSKEKDNQEFEKILQELETPFYIGEGFWSLPENPTPLEKVKYDICQKILAYQQKYKLTDKEIAQRINLTTAETEDILFCRIDYFTLDRLMTYANKLFKAEPLMIGVIKDKNLNGKRKVV